MKKQLAGSTVLLFLAALLIGSAAPGAEGPKDKLDIIKPVPFTAVRLDDEFWASRIETNRASTIPAAFKQCEETGRVDNFVRAAKRLLGEKLEDDKIRGYSFDDTDIYKVLEGAAFGLSVKADPEMEKYLDGLIEKVAAAQEPDGYLFTARTINPEKPHHWAGKERWEKVSQLSHELYNMGHFYEAAIAHYQATGKKTMLDIATKNADLLCKTFGPGKNESWAGHQIIEMALCKLYSTTGKKKYLDLAKFLLDT
ncbi:MAG: glycoside hydrolase family 127 protein, partial [Kiritimatiellia bacterium]|nr:glycoside hydrolase family 127 protein [Kiritimatiellia bacterium]